jgi:exodeoxyribonuclease VII large subunit
VLARGFALVRDADGRPLRQAAGVSAGMQLDIEFSDGRVGAVAERGPAATTDKPAGTTKPRGRRGNGNSNQGSLFDA